MPILVIVGIQCLVLLWSGGIWAQSRGHLGVFIQNVPRPAEGTDVAASQGVVILGLMRNGPAQKAGLKRGDIILKFGGQPIRQVEDLQRVLTATALDETTEIEIFRRDQTLIIPVTIASREAPESIDPPADRLPALWQRDELLWGVLAAAALAVISIYLVSMQPWRRWRQMRAASVAVPARQMRVSNGHVLCVAVGLVLAVLGWSSLIIVQAGHHGVVFHLFKGVHSTPLAEGLHFLLPVLNRVTIYDTRSQVYHVRDRTVSPPRATSQVSDQLLWTPTADGLKVGLDLSVRYRLDPSRLSELHRSVGPDFEGKIVHPIAWNVTRLVASEYSLLDIYGKRRHELQQQALSRVQALFARDGLIGEDLLLREVMYTKEFEKTLITKMVAEQKVQESAYEVQQAELRAQVQVIEAQGEAQALDLVNRAIQDQPLLLQYLWIKSLPERVRVMVVPPHSGRPTPWTKPVQPEAQRAQTGDDQDG